MDPKHRVRKGLPCSMTHLLFLWLFSLFLKELIFSSPEQRSRRAIVLPPASALALASTNIKVLH